MRLRVRAPNGTHTLELEDVATVFDLIHAIRAKTSLQGQLEIRCGYPPKALELPDPETLLIDLPVRVNGEQFIVSEVPGTSPPTGASSGPASGPLSNSSGAPFRAEEREANPSSSSGYAFDGMVPSAVKNFFSSSPSGQSSSTNTPLSLKRKNDALLKGSEPVMRVAGHPDESLTIRIMEDDNSCLFRAINYVCARGIDMMTEMRDVVASTIQRDPEKYTDTVLGMARDEYCRKMTNPNTWGGYIELDILAQYFDVAIWSIDVGTLRIDRFNEHKNTCVIVIYSGIHYDCLALTRSSNPDDSTDDITQFSVEDAGILEAANRLVDILKNRGYNTDTAQFKIRCNDCHKTLRGEKQAQKHHDETGHTSFEQVQD